MTTQYRRGTGADRHDACHALIALDAAADERLVSLPELVREIVGAWLKEQTVVPPDPEEHAKDER